jgi:hypothetical protein
MKALKVQSTKGVNLQQGLAVVELVIAVPLILLVALAVTELGRGMYQYNTLSKAVHDGTRYLSDKARDGAGVVDFANISLLLEETENLIICGTITRCGNGDELLPDFYSKGIVEINPTASGFISDSWGWSGVTDDIHVRITATYEFDALFEGLSELGYSMVPKFEVTAVERILAQ